MTFANPAYLLFAALLCIATYAAYRAILQRRVLQAFTYSNLDFLNAAVGASVWPGRVLFTGILIAVLLIGTALAGPQFVARLPAKDGSVILCVDTSGSMAAQDVAPNRSDASKNAARLFIDALPSGTKVGLVAFSTTAEVVQPLTSDHQTAREGVDRIPTPNGATAIGDALALAAQQLPNTGQRAVVLMTDGVNNTGVDPMTVARFLGSRHVRIYTVGIGTNDSGQLIPGTSEAASIDEQALSALADASDGRYVRVSDAGQLKSALAQLGRTTVLEKKKIDAAVPFALAGGLLLLATFFGGMAAGRFP